MEAERQNVGALGQIAEQSVGRRAGVAALGGEQLDDHGRRLRRPGNGWAKKRRGNQDCHRGEWSNGIFHPFT